MGRVIALDEDYAMGVCEHVLVYRWRVQTRPDALLAGHAVLSALASEHSEVGIMHVIEPAAVPPDGPARTAVVDLIRHGGPALRGTSVVAEGLGFRAALVRGVVTGVTMLARLPSPLKVFESTSAAASWHVEHRAVGDSDQARTAIVALADQLRQELDTRG